MHPVRTPALLATLLVLAASAQAQKMTPGLWETTMSMKSGNGQMNDAMARAQQHMARMPPEQRKQMEEMLARQGVGMGGASKPNAMRVCIGKEQAERMDLPQQAQGRCKRESMERSGNTLRFKVVCTDPPSTGSGEYTFDGDKAYSGHIVVERPSGGKGGGKAERVEMQQQGRWISADCGALKPHTP